MSWHKASLLTASHGRNRGVGQAEFLSGSLEEDPLPGSFLLKSLFPCWFLDGDFSQLLETIHIICYKVLPILKPAMVLLIDDFLSLTSRHSLEFMYISLLI